MFTSQTTVEACQAALTPLGCSHQDGKGSSNRPDVPWKQHLEEQWSSLPVFVVGKATAEAGKMYFHLVSVSTIVCSYTLR